MMTVIRFTKVQNVVCVVDIGEGEVTEFTSKLGTCCVSVPVIGLDLEHVIFVCKYSTSR